MPAGQRVLIQQLTNQAAGTVVSNWFDLSDYTEGKFFIEVTAITGTLTVTFQESPDETGVVAAPAGFTEPTAISATGTTETAVTAPSELAYIRASSVVATGPCTATIYFVGRAG